MAKKIKPAEGNPEERLTEEEQLILRTIRNPPECPEHPKPQFGGCSCMIVNAYKAMER